MANSRMLWVAIVTFFALCAADSSKRTMKTMMYPDCALYPSCVKMINQNATAPNVSFPNVAYVRSALGKDVLHFVMSTVNLPSILVVHTKGDANEKLNFNWDSLLMTDNKTDMSGGVYRNSSLYHGSITYSFVLAFSRLIEYNDFDDSASLTSAEKVAKTQWNFRNFTEFRWMNMTHGQGGKSIIFNTTQPQPAAFGNDTAGSMYFEFEINNDDGRDTDLPRLIYNINNTQMNFVLDKYVPMYNHSRFALEMTVAANHSSEDMNVEELRSIDDEFSPGVFQVVNWYSRGNSDDTGYIQWKPVCYLSAERARSSGTEVMKYPLIKPANVSKGVKVLLKESMAFAFFGDALSDSSKVVQRSSNISFGLSQDEYYLKNNYTAWTASVGYGQAPVESISTTVIIIIIAGLGIPAILVVFGAVYVCVKKRRNGYDNLDDQVSRNNPLLN